MTASVICKVKQEAHRQNANKGQGEAKCFIGIKTLLSALFYIQQELGHASTYP